MTKTVRAVRIASGMAGNVFPRRARNATSGPYADEESPSAPRPTQARNAASEILWNKAGSVIRLAGPIRTPKARRRERIAVDSTGRPPGSGGRPGGGGGGG